MPFNVLAVLIAALAGFVVGGVWYGPLFGSVWQRAASMTPEALAGRNMARVFGLSFVLLLVAAAVPALCIGPDQPVSVGLLAGVAAEAPDPQPLTQQARGLEAGTRRVILVREQSSGDRRDPKRPKEPGSRGRHLHVFGGSALDDRRRESPASRRLAGRHPLALARRSRGHQMNAGAAVAGGKWLLFLHADSRLPPSWFDEIRAAAAAGHPARCFRLGIDAAGCQPGKISIAGRRTGR